MTDNMKDLFYIIKGQYRKEGESFTNKENNNTMYIGGYDPYSPNTTEWYMVIDNKTFNCISCGSDYNKVLKSVYNIIKRHRGVAKNYFKHISNTTSDDYYEVFYLGHKPLNAEQRAKKQEGRTPRVSPVMRCLFSRVIEDYGSYFSEDIRRMEDQAYEDLAQDTPFKRAKKLVKVVASEHTLNTDEDSVEVLEKMTPKKLVKTKTKFGIKKLAL